MASTIRIKRSGNTVSPTTLASGELAYSWAAGAGGKLYLGTGSEIITDQAPNIDVIGGKYFVDMLDHTPGSLQPNSALILNANTKLDQLFIDNIILDGNTISSTTGNLILNPSSNIDVSNKRITNLANPLNANDAVTVAFFQSGINSMVTNGTQSGITVTYNNSLGTLNFVVAGANIGNYVNSLVQGTGVIITNNTGANSTPTIAIGQDVSPTANVSFARITLSNTFITPSATINTLTSPTVTANNVTITNNITTPNITATTAYISTNFTANAATISTLNVTGTLTISGNTTIVNAETIKLADNIITLNSNYPVIAPIEDAGIEINRGSSANTYWLWDETNDRWTGGSSPIHTSGGFVGNATTASTLQTARNITLNGFLVGTTSFNGGSDVTITTSYLANNLILGTQTSGNYAASLAITANTGLTLIGAAGESTDYVLAGIDATTSVKGVSKFDGAIFNVTGGNVTIAYIDGGTY